MILLLSFATARGVVCLSCQGSNVTTEYDTVLGGPSPLHAALSRSAAAADGDGPRIPAVQAARHLTAAQVSSGSTDLGQNPLFPVSGLEIAILCIAGVVLFIAAGELPLVSACSCCPRDMLPPLPGYLLNVSNPACMHPCTRNSQLQQSKQAQRHRRHLQQMPTAPCIAYAGDASCSLHAAAADFTCSPLHAPAADTSFGMHTRTQHPGMPVPTP